jgi:phosphatidylglycerophosphate synthase
MLRPTPGPRTNAIPCRSGIRTLPTSLADRVQVVGVRGEMARRGRASQGRVSMEPVLAAPVAADYRAVARPAGVFTELVDYPVAARLCVLARRRGIRPTVLTLGNLVLGSAASVGVVALAGSVVDDSAVAAVTGVVAWLLWQLAYVCDCSDGQLARVTSTSTAAGGRLDVLCDVAVQVGLVAAVAGVSVAARPGVPSWLVAVFAGSWMVNMVTSVMAKDGTNVSLVSSGSPVVRLVKLVRDYPFMVTVIAGVIAVHPPSMVWVMVFFSAVNVLFLAVSVGQSARTSLRPVE